MDGIKSTFVAKEEYESNKTELTDAIIFSWLTHKKDFAICFVIGFTTSMIGTLMLWHSLKLFTVFYTFGNIYSLVGTCFLLEPVKQLENIFKEKCLIAIIVKLIALILTLEAALWWSKKALAMLFVVIEYFAMAKYCLLCIRIAKNAV